MATFRCHGRLINFQMAEATCDLHGDRTREQKTLQFPASAVLKRRVHLF
ncbi:hypothetical protein USDA257_c02210 [Sinorhizobium fredii USDA 257]|uniref:Uncharacterized protein n=1 Tax=Sinorhizobium fredii (strain USDA 257) TaxID=1185652 RepID=I3WYW3_SINF2|nr:hypothetical protein USDA257_c02210 [Sinorhizobium fredii USDA 257]